MSGAATATAPLASAQLCWQIVNLELDYDGTIAAARAHLEHVVDAGDGTDLPGASSVLAAAAGAAPLGSALLALARGQRGRDLRAVCPHADLAQQRYLLTQCAPHALLTGCTLQNFNHAANCHEALPALVHAVHSWQLGGGRLERNAASQYRRLLEQHGIELAPIRSARFEASGAFHPAAWDLPAYQLSLSLFPHSRRAELLGAALFDLCCGIDQLVLPEPLAAHVAAAGYARLRAGAPAGQAMQAMLGAIALEVEQHGDSGAIARGFMHSMALYGKLLDALAAHLQAGHQHPHDDMVRLMHAKARYAVGYHSKLKLGGSAFEQLLTDDPDAFVVQLGRSRWVTPGRPEASLLITKLVGFGGPMFRVFSEDELTIISAWIASLDKQAAAPAQYAIANPAPSAAPALADGARPPRAATAPDARTLYHRLLNNEQCPQLRAAALDYVDTWFGRSAARLARQPHDMPFRQYSHARLRAWFEQEALTQAGSYVEQPPDAGKTREDVIDDALQLCPMVFIDGAWLQKWGNAGLAETRVGAILYKIFSDEIGNGSVVENHPNIYRALMDEMQTGLPDFRSEAFAYSDKFDDAAFAVPAFWLGLSQFPLRYLPETLGINLAMELSGVGSAYRSARNELKHHGFSTLFVELHNTIDNVSSGHSAMAIHAIEHHMDDILALHDAGLAAQHWERVWTGYRSLSEPPRRWTELLRKPRYRATVR